jgi:hypothetical protein
MGPPELNLNKKKNNNFLMYVVTVRRSRSVCFLIFADLAGVEGLWVLLMLGDVPSLLEHLENNQHGERSLTLPSL